MTYAPCKFGLYLFVYRRLGKNVPYISCLTCAAAWCNIAATVNETCIFWSLMKPAFNQASIREKNVDSLGPAYFNYGMWLITWGQKLCS